MSDQILFTKLFFPTPRSDIVARKHLIEKLNDGLHCKLTLVSAPAGFGKTTLVGEWLKSLNIPIAWFSVDEQDNDPARFLTYLIASMQNIKPGIGQNLQPILRSQEILPVENILTLLLNEISIIEENFLIILDDYHAIDSQQVDQTLDFLIEHQPPQMHLVITTREDPDLPLARLRGRGQCIELRAADLRFTQSEASDFFNRIMKLNLSDQNVNALEARTEGWIAGLQMAAISLEGLQDKESFIQSFTGSHRFVMDYLIEEVLHRQSENIQTFLQKSSILDNMCGSLCDAILQDPRNSSQSTLECLERTNLFIIPEDNERRWYRYHHLFRDLLRQHLGQRIAPEEIAELHIRASKWLEDNNFYFEAFHHAIAADDIDHAERLIESEDIGLHFRSVASTVLDWLTSLPKSVLDTRPRLRVRTATTALMMWKLSDVEENLQAAEAIFALQTSKQNIEPNDQIRDLIGQIACARATLALFRYDAVEMITQARRALEYLHPNNLTYRFTANWALTSAFMFQGDRARATQACRESIDISSKSGHVFSKILSASNMGALLEMDNQLYQAAETYHQVLQLFGTHPQPNASIAMLGLARISYEWNDLSAAEQYGLQSLQLSRQLDSMVDRYIVSEVFLAHIKFTRGEIDGATDQLAQAEQKAHQKKFLLRLPEIASVQVSVLLRQGRFDAAAQLVQKFDLPLCKARVELAQGNPTGALTLAEACRQQMEDRGWADEMLKAMKFQAIVLYALGKIDEAVQLLSNVLAITEPNGFIRFFLDEGETMAELLQATASQGFYQNYVARLLTAFEAEKKEYQEQTTLHELQSFPQNTRLFEPLSPRELEILRLLVKGLSNQQISQCLFIALDTVKGHNRKIFDKLNVKSRSGAIARAHELNLL